uniref:NADH-ubiquinone oxidoreductase chain 4 n=1 Tax=Colobopsis nipponica TaxID=2681982 RepID=A0A7S6XWW3_9HYME|nr:NADH dehydrogenase subunit 4 [Colobopsis nipponica]QOW83439.1 NADH dehydrogenase subunit 4 [Colobopsis nipponica]
MIKFVMIIFFMCLMMMFNKKIMYYYNLCFLISFFFLFKYMFKDGVWVSISLSYGFDFYSYNLLLLSFWIIGLMFMVIQLEKMSVVKSLMFLVMMMILIIFFLSMNLLLFYFMFELSLIPVFMLIIYWGLNFERLSASFYLLLYTMFVSLPLLVYIMKMLKLYKTLEMSLMKMGVMNLSVLDYLILFLAFLIKMPIYMFHSWLPKAHVEAPVYGSMILAAILLKLGSYGLLRFIDIFLFSSLKYNYLIFSVGIVGSFIVSLVCLIQVDMKSLVAYSSVVHMNMLMCSVYTMTKLGFMSSYILMISHGLCSSALFFMVNLYYERSLSRLMFLNKGMMSIYPSLSVWWFGFCVINFSFPFSLNFISELLLIMVIISFDIILMIYIMLVCFFSSVYSLYLYSYIQHGQVYSENNKKFYVIYLSDYLILIVHMVPLVLMIFNLVLF